MDRPARRILRLLAVLLLTITLGLGLAGAAAAATTEFPVPTFVGPESITTGPDRNLWFTEGRGNRIGRITQVGVISLFGTGAATNPHGITAGPDGNLWFTERAGNAIGRITPAGAITRFLLPPGDNRPTGITTGPDGNLWFTEQGGNRIGRLTPGFVLTRFSIPTADSQPFSIAPGADGNLWFTETAGNAIGRITPFGKITEFPLPQPLPFTFNPTLRREPLTITSGPDGNLWFTEGNGGAVGRITVAGEITEFSVPNPNSRPFGITAALDGNLWFTEENGAVVGIITTAGVVSELAIPTARSGAHGITLGPDGNLWLVETAVNAVARITPPSVAFRKISPIPPVVQALALGALGRGLEPADQGAFEAFLGANCGPAGFDAMARAFFGSAEFQTVRQLTLPGTVSALYQSLLGRLPDAAGIAAWSAVLRQHRLAVAAGFIRSAEFQRLLPDRRDRAAVALVVTRLYEEILERDPDPAGLAGWIDYIVTTGDLEGAAAGFLASGEFEWHPLTLQEYVALLYRTFLGRTPDDAGLAGWTAFLDSALLEVIHQGFGASPEFRSRVRDVCGP